MQLSSDFRSNLRFFAFWVGNRTLLEPYPDSNSESLEYMQLLVQRNDTFGQLFAIYLNVLPVGTYGEFLPGNGGTAEARATQWLRHICDQLFNVTPPLAPWEIALDTADRPWKQAVKEFALEFGRGVLVPDILASTDYISTLATEPGSWLEMVFSIFSNVLLIDEGGYPLNTERAARRAAMYIRQFQDPAFEAAPPFAAWEVELAT